MQNPQECNRPQFDFDSWRDAFEYVAKCHGLQVSVDTGAELASEAEVQDLSLSKYLQKLALVYGLQLDPIKFSRQNFYRTKLPIIVMLTDGRIGVLTERTNDRLAFRGAGGEQDQMLLFSSPEVEAVVSIALLAIPVRIQTDARIDQFIQPIRKNALLKIASRDLRFYIYVILASFTSSLLALAGAVFSMQVYDRVIPAQSVNTLYVLFLGLGLAVSFDFMLRRVRAAIIDIVGKRADIEISDLAFDHALKVKNQSRPNSTSTFVAQLRDLEQVRELMTSTSVAALADLPFFLIFLGVFWLIGGSLAVIPIVAVAAMVLPVALMQRSLYFSAQDAMRHSSLRNALLVEALQGIEDVKLTQSENFLQTKLNMLNSRAAQAQLKLRSISSGLNAWNILVQSMTYAVVILVGAPIVISGNMTTGTLVACSILCSRIMAPMAQLAQVLGRLQQARVGMKSVDAILQLPTDDPPDEFRLSAPNILGEYRLKKAEFRYQSNVVKPALYVKDLTILSGEKVGIVGQNGAGKSTLLRALSGMLEASAGEILIDRLAMHQIHAASLRRDVGLLTQDARLFYGTIRDNVTMGSRHASDDEVSHALELGSATKFVRSLSKGLDHMILEGGRDLSGGQRQCLLLSRLFLRRPSVFLLDEPTAAMDQRSEQEFIHRFPQWSANSTVVMATHRTRILDLVDRVIVVKNGEVSQTGKREDVIPELLKSARNVETSMNSDASFGRAS